MSLRKPRIQFSSLFKLSIQFFVNFLMWINLKSLLKQPKVNMAVEMSLNYKQLSFELLKYNDIKVIQKWK
ncbi:hypothetical protein RIR_jg19711.t1 [Rhizophagus irregularis DAOM 181602=DAOM 197198]|nr:hypothetical protein RIR_jg19711.t1 [Rhizophagus irregularis DAOM 181602=DAOM 197198]